MAANKNYEGQLVPPSLVRDVEEPLDMRSRRVIAGLSLVNCSLALIVALTTLIVGCSPPGRRELLEGKRLIEQGRPQEAVEPLKRAMSLFGTNTPAAARAWNWLGLAYHHSGQANDALQAYQNAIKCDFNFFPARYNLGCLLLEHTNFAGAINEFFTYTSHRPNDPSGWLQLGTAQYRARLYDQAEKNLQRVIDLNAPAADCAEAMNLIGMCLAAKRRHQDAMRAFEAALNFQSGYAPALLNHAIVAQTQLGNLALAIQKYRDYLNAIGGPTNNPSVAVLVAQLEASLQPRSAGTNHVSQSTLTNRIVYVAPQPTNGDAAVRASVPATTQAVATVQPSKPAAVKTNLVVDQPEVGEAQKLASKPIQDRSNAVVAAVADQPKLTQPAAPPPTETKTNAAVPENKTEEAAAPVELVKLEDERPVKPATTIELPQKQSGQTQQVAVVAAPVAPSNPPTVQPVVATASQPGTAAAAPTEETVTTRRSWVQKLNPLNLFRSGSKTSAEQTRPTPLPPASVASASTTRDRVQPVQDETPPERLRPSFPRYAYLSPPVPAPGNRAAAETHYAAGLSFQKSGNMAQAIRSYQEAVAADPTYFEAHYNLGVAAYDARNWQIALQACENALAIRPNDFGARLNFALTLERAGYPADAAKELETLLTLHPNKPEVHLAAANLYAQVLDDKSMARAHYSRVLELDPRHPQAAAIRRWLLANRNR